MYTFYIQIYALLHVRTLFTLVLTGPLKSSVTTELEAEASGFFSYNYYTKLIEVPYSSKFSWFKIFVKLLKSHQC